MSIQPEIPMHRMLLALSFCVACVLASLAGMPAAHAAEGDYSIDELSTALEIQADGSIHVVERQIITFSDTNINLIWYLHAPENGESVRVASVRAAPVDNGGAALGNWTSLQLVDVDVRRQGVNPGDMAAPGLRTSRTRPWYSYSISDGMVRAFFPAASAASAASTASAATAATAVGTAGEATPRTYLVETDYIVAHRVRVFRDVAELYWRYAHDSLPADAAEANLQVTLPVPADAPEIKAGTDVVAWGHGPDTGTFEIGPDGSVAYHVDLVERGAYAEAHLLFPTSWMTNLPERAANQFSETRRASAIAEEAQWVDAGTRGALWDNKVRILFLAFAILVILVGVAFVFRHGRSPRSRRSLVRTAATLAIIAVGEQLFFREPLTTAMVAALSAIVAIVSLALPQKEELEAWGPEEQHPEAQPAEERVVDTRESESWETEGRAAKEQMPEVQKAGSRAAPKEREPGEREPENPSTDTQSSEPQKLEKETVYESRE